MPRTLATTACLLLAVGVAGAGERPAAGRTLQTRTPLGPVALYLPAGHTPAKSWPLLVFLPGREGPTDKWLKLWRKTADRQGLVVALPVPSKPHASTGYPPMAPVIITRAALAAAGVDENRVAAVGHRAAGFGLVNTAISFPRMCRAAVVVGSAPPQIRADRELAGRMPPLLFLCEDRRVRGAVDRYAKQSAGLRIDIGKLKGAEGPFEPRFVAEIAAWIGRQFPMGGRDRKKAPAAQLNQKRSAELLAEATALRARGAEAGAYVTLLAANRLAKKPFDTAMALARICLDGRRFNEAVEWADRAAAADPGKSSPHLVAANALLKMGHFKPALDRLARAGESGAALAALVEKRRAAFEKVDPRTAFGHYRQAVGQLRAAKFAAAEIAAASAVRLAPTEASYRTLLAHALLQTKGLDAAEKSLQDFLELFPDDPYIKPLSACLAATRRTDYARPGHPPAKSIALGKIPPTGPASGFLSAMVRTAGHPIDIAELGDKLTAGGANRLLLHALPLLRQETIPFSVGRGSRKDLIAKLESGVPVLVQMPPGGLAGLRSTEKFNVGIPRVVIGYDDGAKCFLVQDYGSAGTVRIPYALFDRLWSSLDRWWLALTPARAKLPGDQGQLTEAELGSALAENRDLRSALATFDKALRTSPARARLGAGMVLANQGKYAQARERLAGLKDSAPEIAIQVALTLGQIEQAQTPGTLPEKALRSLPHYRRAWKLDPGNERSLLRLCAALMTLARPGDRSEARGKLEDFLRYRPASAGCLRLLYSR